MSPSLALGLGSLPPNPASNEEIPYPNPTLLYLMRPWDLTDRLLL